MNDKIGTSSELGATDLLRRVAAAVAIATGLLLLAPAVTAGAQTDDETTTTTVEGDETTTTLEGDETTTTVEGDETTTTVEEATSTTVPLSSVVTAEDAPNIRVEINHDEEQGPCTESPVLAMRHAAGSEAPYDESSTEEQTFRLKIQVDQELCKPIEAVAVIYAMPGNGEAWPQTLQERLEFTIDKAGDYEVIFVKTCAAVQFDVITGDTPPVIAPLGEWHGPLLFPLDPDSSLQHWGCAEVADITTIAPAEEVQPEQLAFTGSTSTPVALLGALLLLAGAGALLLARRRED